MCLKLNSKIVGIIGGGQLGMMLAMAIKKLGGKVIGLDPNPKCSITHVCDSFIVHHMMMRLPLESYVRSQML